MMHRRIRKLHQLGFSCAGQTLFSRPINFCVCTQECIRHTQECIRLPYFSLGQNSQSKRKRMRWKNPFFLFLPQYLQNHKKKERSGAQQQPTVGVVIILYLLWKIKIKYTVNLLCNVANANRKRRRMTGLSDMNRVLVFHFCSPCRKTSNKSFGVMLRQRFIKIYCVAKGN